MSEMLLISEQNSGLGVTAKLLDDLAPDVVAFIRSWLSVPRKTHSIHAMWTGPEISSGIDADELPARSREAELPLQNATLYPLAGDLVFLKIAGRVWGGGPEPIFDIGLFYGPHARLHFPIGYVPGSVFAKIPSDQWSALAVACQSIRAQGRVMLEWKLGS